ncbi:MAG: PAS domain S-box protein [Deltaproteobacteria bacterium]|nr:PAS domain S-box protein [Deltaproteobacteria bacterium]
MEQLSDENKALHENILDHMKVAVTYVDAEGNILYANTAARKRPSKTPRDVGVNMRECHKDTSNEKIIEIFRDFRNGRSKPHHYVSTLGGGRVLVTMIPMFEAGAFSGCVSQVHPLTLEGPERSF